MSFVLSESSPDMEWVVMKCEDLCVKLFVAESSCLIGQLITPRPSRWPGVITHHFSQFRDVLWDKLASLCLECAMAGAELSSTILCYWSTLAMIFHL